MKTEPNIDTFNLIEVISTQYGITLHKLNFLPEGEDGILYTSVGQDNKVYVVKFIGVRRDYELDNIQTRLRFSRELKNKNNLDFVVPPLKTKDDHFHIIFDSKSVAVFPFIEGDLSSIRELSEEKMKMIAQATAQLHMVKDFPNNFPKEELGINDFDDFVSRMEALEDYTGLSKYSAEFVEIILPIRERLIKEVDTYKKHYQNIKNWDMVVCHKDLSPGNIIFDAKGNMKIIDWDSIALSLPEADVSSFTHPQYFKIFYGEYMKHVDLKLQHDSFAMHGYKGNLEDIWERMETILDPSFSNEQKEHEIKGLKKELLGHQSLGGRLNLIKEVLEENEIT